MVKAGFWPRLVAYVIDSIIVRLVSNFIAKIIMPPPGDDGGLLVLGLA